MPPFDHADATSKAPRSDNFTAHPLIDWNDKESQHIFRTMPHDGTASGDNPGDQGNGHGHHRRHHGHGHHQRSQNHDQITSDNDLNSELDTALKNNIFQSSFD